MGIQQSRAIRISNLTLSNVMNRNLHTEVKTPCVYGLNRSCDTYADQCQHCEDRNKYATIQRQRPCVFWSRLDCDKIKDRCAYCIMKNSCHWHPYIFRNCNRFPCRDCIKK